MRAYNDLRCRQPRCWLLCLVRAEQSLYSLCQQLYTEQSHRPNYSLSCNRDIREREEREREERIKYR